MTNSDNITKVTVDSDILDFITYAYFGGSTNKIEAASRRAYLDMNRTIRFDDFPKDDRYQLRLLVQKIFEEEIPLLLGNSISTQSDFDAWHFHVCQEIISHYQKVGISFTFGQAQKWLNMTIKYLYMLEYDVFHHTFPFFHVPLDNYIFDVVDKELFIRKPDNPWSRIDDYWVYLDYQKQIREKLTDSSPLRWEFRYWLKAIRNY